MADAPEVTDTTNSAPAGNDAPAGDAAAAAGSDEASLLGGATAGAGNGEGDSAGNDAPAEGDKGADGEGDGASDKPEGPPETYALTMPDGVEMDAALLDEASPVLKELGLSNEAANKLVPLVTKVQERILTAQADDFAATAAQWARDAKADTEIGGRNWSTTEHNVARAMDHFIGPKTVTGADGKEVPNAFRQLLDDTRLGNHPEMLRAFAKIGAALGEDSNFVRGDATPASKKTDAEIFYGKPAS